MSSKQTRVMYATREAESLEERFQTCIPSTGGFLEPIQRLLEFANMLREAGINIAQWLRHVDSFIKHAMKKSIGNIQLIDEPIVAHGE